MNDKAKRQRISEMSTVAIENTLATLSDQEREGEPTQERPLQGIVSYEGIGQVKVSWLREELSRRLVSQATGSHEHTHTIDLQGKPVCVYCGEELEL